MNISEIVNKEYKGKDVSIYATSETITDFLCENDIRISGNKNIEETLNENDYVILSRICVKNTKVWILEEVFDEWGDQIHDETDVAIIVDEVIELIELDNLVADEIVLLFEEEADSADELDSYFDDLIEDFINELEDEDTCVHCKLKELLFDVYDTARKDLLVELLEEVE